VGPEHNEMIKSQLSGIIGKVELLNKRVPLIFVSGMGNSDNTDFKNVTRKKTLSDFQSF
jgi:hypothetical protein